MCKPVWWPARVPFTDINNSKQRPKSNELILIMESYRNWNVQDAPVLSPTAEFKDILGSQLTVVINGSRFGNLR